MKTITFLLLFLVSSAMAQEDTLRYIKYPASQVQYGGIWAKTYLRIPDTSRVNAKPGAVGINASGTSLFLWNGTSWISVNSSVIDTLIYSTRKWRQKGDDSLGALLSLKQGAITLTTTGSSGASTLVGNTLNIPQYSGTIFDTSTLNLVTRFSEKTNTGRLISTTSPLSGGGDLSANRTLSITQANTSTNGFISSTDWNTFNNKQQAGDFISKSDSTLYSTKANATKQRDSVVGLLANKLNIADTANIRFRPQAGANITLTGTYPNISFAASSGTTYFAQSPITLSSTTFGADTTILGTRGHTNNDSAIVGGRLTSVINTTNSNVATNTTNIALKKDNTDSIATTGYTTIGKHRNDSTVLRSLINTNTTNISTNTSNIALKKNISDSGYTNGLTAYAAIGTLGKVRDSLSSVIATKGTGTVTSIATNTGSGITGGTITNTGTIAADTTVLGTKGYALNLSNGSLKTAGYGLVKSGQSVFLDTSSYHKYFNSPLRILNDSTCVLDTAVTNRAFAVTWGGLQYRLDSLKTASWFGGSTSQWTTITNDIYYNTGRVLIGGTSSPASTLEVRTPNLGTIGTTYSPTNGISIINNTPATISQNQEVVVLQSEGTGWKTNATAGSQYSGWKLRQAISTGAANPTSTWNFDYSINRASSTTPFTFGSTGAFTATGTGTINGAVTLGSGLTVNGGGSTFTTGSINYTENAGAASSLTGLSIRPTSAASGAGNTQWSPTLKQNSNVASGSTNYFSEMFLQNRGIYTASGVPTSQWVFSNRTSTTATGTINDIMNLSDAGGLYIGGNTYPTAVLHLKAGTATANTAPIKLTSGTNLTTVENGTIEYDGTEYYVTAQGTRQNIHKGKYGSVSATGTATTTFTVTFGGTQPNTTYKAFVQPTNALTAVMNYVTNQTTTTFDVVFATALTGTVSFVWNLIQ